jgi:hypothetical protein
MLPGQTTLTFKTPAATLTLAALSLADRHLQSKTLRQWAQQTLPAIVAHPGGAWTESPTQAVFTLKTRHLLRSLTHHLTLTHDHETNRLLYTHQKSS